jgi:hypothetical protein
LNEPRLLKWGTIDNNDGSTNFIGAARKSSYIKLKEGAELLTGGETI